MTQRNSSRDAAGKHLTTRRGFVAAMSFGVVSLYGLWAAYGAAPTNLDFGAGETGGGMEHGGGGGMPGDEFRRLAERFIEENSLPDGSVKPGAGAMAAGPPDAHDAPGGLAEGANAAAATDGHGMAAMVDENPEGGHGMAEAAGGHEMATAMRPVVYMMCDAWSYQPGLLRLTRDVPYRFRMMALDTDHGASISMGQGSRIIRLRRNVLVEQNITFTAAGAYPVYCTVYCGQAHDYMRGMIVVA